MTIKSSNQKSRLQVHQQAQQRQAQQQNQLDLDREISRIDGPSMGRDNPLTTILSKCRN